MSNSLCNVSILSLLIKQKKTNKKGRVRKKTTSTRTNIAINNERVLSVPSVCCELFVVASERLLFFYVVASSECHCVNIAMWIVVVVLSLLAAVRSLDVPPKPFPGKAVIRELQQTTLRVDKFHQNNVISLLRRGEIVQSIRLDDALGQDAVVTQRRNTITLQSIEQTVSVDVLQNRPDFSLVKISRVLNSSQTASDCVDLATGHLSWYGGLQIFHQYWPVEKLTLANYSYVAKQQDNVGVAERYWLNSKGAFVYVEETAPLFIDQNVRDGNELCLKVQNALPYNVRRTSFPFVYYIGVGRDAKQVHREAVKIFLKKPTAVPDERMVEHPIWSTWARYKVDINETVIERFANEILSNGFNHSQLEIDDDWEVCYGALTFRSSKFPNIANLTSRLKARGFRVTLWVHPFINKGCDPWYSEAKRLG